MSPEIFNVENSYLNLPEVFYTPLKPTPVSSPQLVSFNNDLANRLELDHSSLTTEEKASLFSGNTVPSNTTTFAQAYAGHQFGHFAILGDGRAHMLGEHVLADGTRFDIQFKGSGPTPYSRNGDGRAVLGPMLREYIISESMHALGIPTTRSLAVVSTGESVRRERPLPGAILTRVAQSHLRVGTFEFAATRGPETVKQLLDYAITRHAPELLDSKTPALSFFKHVMTLQIDLIVNWMRVGFIHGVMNTDNMSISGETIDYGPCAFMNQYHPDTVYSYIDEMGRYAFKNQSGIAQWNLARFAEALLPHFDEDKHTAIDMANEVLESYTTHYEEKWTQMMGKKLGFSHSVEGDDTLISELLDWMQRTKADYTTTFRDLCSDSLPTGQYDKDSEFTTWHKSWENRLHSQDRSIAESKTQMKSVNPAVIPRNPIVEEALSASHEGNFEPFHEILTQVASPYEDPIVRSAIHEVPEPSEDIDYTFCGT